MKKDLIFFIRYIKGFIKNRRLVFGTVGIFFLMGLITYLFTPKTFESSVSFIPQVSENVSVGTNLKNIAEVIGLNIGASKDEQSNLPVYLYPKIINSYSYQKQVLETPLKFKNIDSSISFREYFIDVKKPGVVEKIKKSLRFVLRGFRKERSIVSLSRIDSLEYISKEDIQLSTILSSVLLFSINEDDGTLIIKAQMPEAVPAAQLAENAKVILQKEVINYRIKKAKEKYNFIEDQYEEKKKEFLKAQNDLASYIDRNAYNTTEQSKIRLQKLQSDYALISSVYAELEQQKLAQSIKIQEDTPLFTTLNPAVVPLTPTNSGFIIVMAKFIFLGIIISIMAYVVITVYQVLKSIWKEIDHN